jgi:hypothetical protein
MMTHDRVLEAMEERFKDCSDVRCDPDEGAPPAGTVTPSVVNEWLKSIGEIGWEAVWFARFGRRGISLRQTPIGELMMIEDEINEHQKMLNESKRHAREFIVDHCIHNPLSDEVIDRLAEHVRSGEPLCCADGRKHLLKFVDPVWAKVINAWAYDKLACEEDDSERLSRLSEVVLVLKNRGRFFAWVQRANLP